MKIDKHINLLIDIYGLKSLYLKYILCALLTSSTREGLYWALIYFSQIVQSKPYMKNNYGSILIGLFTINIPIERYFNYIKNLFIKELKEANTKFFINKLSNVSKTKIMNINLIEYNNNIEYINDSLDQYVYNIKILYDIPLRFISLYVIAVNKNLKYLVKLFFIYIIIIKILNDHYILKKSKLNKDNITYENIIRNYIIHSKNLLINNNINVNYLNKNIGILQSINKTINEINSNLDLKMNICILFYILIILKININILSTTDFLYYFLLIYDIEYVGDKITEYYKNKLHLNKMEKRIEYLYEFHQKDENRCYKNIDINHINIIRIINDLPKLNIHNIYINKNDHMLIDGVSGSGKTSLLYILNGLIKPQYIDITPNLNLLITQTYLTLVDHINIYSSYLYDIITNYEQDPDENLIFKCLNLSKFIYLNKANYFIDIDKISSGEKIRLSIAKIIYIVLKNNYKILLFDEIDKNLNDELAIAICKNIKTIFANKIILYITHNQKVKSLFTKVIYINNGKNIK
jgi:ABC-type lipoprotein export system ATPase subunit